MRPAHARVEVLELVSKVFTKSEFKPEEFLRFIHDPMHALHAGDWGVERTKDRYTRCGSILVSKSVKNIIDKLFQNVIGDSVELDFELDETYGNMIIDVIETLCDEGKCLDYCRCNYPGKVRVWSHIVYHKTLEECAKVKEISKKDFIKFIKDFNIYSVLSKYDWSNENNREIDDEKALDFILASFFLQKGHFEGLYIEMEKYDRFDEHLFKNCIDGKCDYDYKERIVWESKNKIEAPVDNSSINRTRPMSFIKAKNYEPTKKTIPRYKILSISCKCSNDKTIYELRNYSRKNTGTTISKNKKLEKVFFKYFNKDRILSKAQANVAAKLMTRQCIPKADRLDSGERHTKILLKENIRKWSEIAALIPDLESAMKTEGSEKQKIRRWKTNATANASK